MNEIHLDSDVVVVGLGPVGTALAGLLGKRGVSVIAIDREQDVFALPRAAHIDHQGLRLLQELGCLDELMPKMIPNRGLDFLTASGETLFRIPGDQPSISGLPASMYFHQPAFDRQLRAVVARMPPVTLRVGVEMVGFESSEDDVLVAIRDEAGLSGSLRARWLIGCDGGGSSIREDAGMHLKSWNFDESWVVVDLLLEGTIDTLPDRALNVCDPHRPTTAIPIPDGRFRFEVMVLPGEDPETLRRSENVLPLLSRWVPSERVAIERSAVYTFHGLLAEQWRAGRVLIAGDAAHQMPPFLGQGMNSGLRDAVNLAWKLAMVVEGRAPETLLDTYGSERAAHVGAIIDAAIHYGRMTCTLDVDVAAERDRRFSVDSRPLTERLPFSLPSLRQGPLVRRGGGELFLQPSADSSGGVRLDDIVDGRFLVVGRSADDVASASWWTDELGALVKTLAQLPGSAEIERWLDRRKADVVVVRPDHYVLGANGDLESLAREVAPLLRTALAVDDPGSPLLVR